MEAGISTTACRVRSTNGVNSWTVYLCGRRAWVAVQRTRINCVGMCGQNARVSNFLAISTTAHVAHTRYRGLEFRHEQQLYALYHPWRVLQVPAI